MIEINGHLANVEQRPSPNRGGRIEPQLIVLHETASHLTKGNACGWLCNPSSKVSAHFTVERDGTVYQLLPCDVAGWHTGASSWNGRRDSKGTCNSFSIGIEIVGPGVLTKRDSRTLVSSFGARFPIEDGEEITSAPHGGRRWWLKFTDAQVAAVDELVKALLAAYPAITGLKGHYEIEIPDGRKVDPAPTFPIEMSRSLLWDRAPLDRGFVRQTQERLASLLYDVGEIDGWAGPKLRAATKAFQEQNGLAQTGELDAATRLKLGDADAVAMPTGTRTETTKADVASVETTLIKRSSEAQGGIELVQAGVSLSDALTKASKAKASGDQLQVILGWVASPAGVRTLVVLGICTFCWWGANKIDWGRVRARVLGFTTRSA